MEVPRAILRRLYPESFALEQFVELPIVHQAGIDVERSLEAHLPPELDSGLGQRGIVIPARQGERGADAIFGAAQLQIGQIPAI